MQKELKKALISVADFMSMVNSHYYVHQMPVGGKGDFITSPEISQLFGEVIAIWCIMSWQKIGKPPKINLIEMGPGRGTLMDDILRTLSKYEIYHAIENIYLLEINHSLKKIQEEKLAKYSDSGLKIHWCDNLEQIGSFSENIPSIFIANEFFDCLPIDQYIYQDNSWHKVMIDLRSKEFSYIKDSKGDIIEISDISSKIISQIATYLTNNHGAALIIDYGYFEANHKISSLQGVRNHQYHDIFSALGEVDISAHVDFSALMEIVKNLGIKDIEFSTQSEFLAKYGIESRAQNLYEKANISQKAHIALALDRLTGENKMGSLFKVLDFYS